MTIRALCLATALSSASAAAPTNGTAVLLARGDVLAALSLTSGGSAASMSLSTDLAPWSGLPYLNLSYNLSSPDSYNALVSPSDSAALSGVPAALALRWSIFLPGGASTGAAIIVRDANGTSFGANPWCGAGWTNVSLPLPLAGGPNVSGAWWPAGRRMVLPLASVQIGVDKHTPPAGWVGLADLAVVSSAAPGAIPRAATLTLLQPRADVSGVLVAGGAEPAAALGALVTNRLERPCGVALQLQMLNASGAGGEGAWAACGGAPPAELAPWQSVTLTCDVDGSRSPAGYVAVRVVFSACACWTANDTQAVVEAAVVIALPQPPVAPVARNVRAAVFGGQMSPSFGALQRIGMWSIRSGPMWRWAQTADCWEPSCFAGFRQFYDAGIFGASAAGIEVMLDARAVPAASYAAARNDSGPTWQSFPGPAHYGDYTRYLTVMLARYGSVVASVEVDNEDDGIHYFLPSPPPMDYVLDLSLALINCTAAALAAAAPNASGLELMGLSSSMFDVMQEGNANSTWMSYERAILGAPGVLAQLAAVTAHPYTLGEIPYYQQPWANVSFLFPNETAAGRNSTVGGLMELARAMSAAAAAQGIAGYHPRLRPSEAGYDLQLGAALASGWSVMHAALIAQLLLHARSAPLAAHVEKLFLFAADDGCCVEGGGFFGAFRPGFLREGADAADDWIPPGAPGGGGWPKAMTADKTPLPAAAAYATASALADVPSKRLAGVFVVDNSADGAASGAPSCVAFEPDPRAPPPAAAPLAVVFTTQHHFNDRVAATLLAATARPADAAVMNGLGAPLAGVLAPAAGGVRATLSIAPLPTYILLPADASATQACASLAW